MTPRGYALAVLLLLSLIAYANMYLGPAPASGELIFSLRAARALTAASVGASLGVAGALLQAVLRNPLATPYTLGVSQAASFGAAYAIVFLGAGMGATAYPVALEPYIIVSSSFLSSLAALGLVYALSRLGGLSGYSMILAGIAVGFIFQAGLMLIEYLAPHEALVSMILFWMFGDTSRPTLPQAILITATVLVVTLATYPTSLALDALSLGEEYARGMGVNTARLRVLGLTASSLLAAVATCFTGVIGFIGLLAPHTVRLAVGSSNRYVLPLSALTGSALLLASDYATRIVFYPFSPPVGVVVSLVGSPVMIVFMVRWGRWRASAWLG